MGSMSGTNPVYLVHLVYLVQLVGLVEPNKQDKPSKLNNSLARDPDGLRST